MEHLITIAEMEYTKPLLVPNAYTTPVWKYILWNEYEKNLPFMADEDDYPSAALYISNIIINNEEYLKSSSIDECLSLEKSYFLDGNCVYIHYEGHDPPFIFLSQKYGSLMGYTNRESLAMEVRPGIILQYKHGLVSSPAISESTDPLSYGRMQFNSNTYTFNNSLAEFDSLGNLFGNEFNVRLGKAGWSYNQYRKIAQYYISNISINLNEADFDVKDKRERISSKAPNVFYSKSVYPFIEDKYADKLIQDAYGKCYGVPGVCLNAFDIYKEKNDYPPESEQKTTERHFKFANKIRRVDELWVKMSANEYSSTAAGREGWTQIYPRQEGQLGSLIPDNFLELKDEGILILPVSAAHAGGKVDNSVNEVRLTGLFGDYDKSWQIIKDIAERYAQLRYHLNNYDTDEFENELGNLPDIGILLDTEKNIYEWIEQIQNGSLMGFQFTSKFNQFTVRVDNPNRLESFDIKAEDILYLHDAEVDFNAEFYATYSDIKYAKTYTPDKDEDEYSHIINKSLRDKVLDSHRLDKPIELETLLPDRESADLKGRMVMEDLSEVRPVLRGIKLFGEKWFDLRIYDTGYIDFSVKYEEIEMYPVQIVQLLNYMNGNNEMYIYHRKKFADIDQAITLIPPNNKKKRGERIFLGKLRCQILRREIDPETGIVTVDARHRPRSKL